MKRISEVIKPLASLIFGALLLLYYLNWLRGQEMVLAIGIVAVVVAAFYLTVGVLDVVLGEKLPASARKVFDVASLVLFPAFMFVYFLLVCINGADILGPTGWVIAILSMIGSLGLIVLALIYKLSPSPLLKRLSLLLASVFTLILLLNVLFDEPGNPIVLGAIDIIKLVMYFLFSFMLCNLLIREEPKAEQAPAEETPREEAEQPKE